MVKVNIFTYPTSPPKDKDMVGEHVSLLNLQAIFSFTNKRTVYPPLTSFLFTQSFCGNAWKSQETHARLFQDGAELSPLPP